MRKSSRKELGHKMTAIDDNFSYQQLFDIRQIVNIGKKYQKLINAIFQRTYYTNNITKAGQMSLAKFAAFTTIASASGLAYIKYIQTNEYNRKKEQLKEKNQLNKFLFDAAEQASYFIDDIMLSFQKSYNISHIDRYKSTLLKFVEGKTLETCAGSNRNLKFYPPGTDLTLIDWSPKMVSTGINKTLPTIKYNYVIGDVTKMPFADNQFDTVVDLFGLENVLMPRKALSQIRRVCKKDGTILLMNQGLSGIVEFHYWQNFISGKNLIQRGVFTNRNWQKLVKQFDFQIVHEQRKKNGKLYIYVLKNKKDKEFTLVPQQNTN